MLCIAARGLSRGTLTHTTDRRTHARAWVIAAAASGAGKTTITAGLLRALVRRGVAVRAAKSGPDYIDAGFHAAAGALRGPNLDTWAMPAAVLDAILRDAASGAELLLIEGAMGLFDGVSEPLTERLDGAGERDVAAKGEHTTAQDTVTADVGERRADPRGLDGAARGRVRTGAASDLAGRYAIPVLAVLDVFAQAQTAAAVLRGLATHDAAVHVAGVVLNRVAGDRHREMIERAIAPLGIPVLGALPHDTRMSLPSRHLGLVQASEHAALGATLDCIADRVEKHIDLDALCRGARAPSLALPQAVPSLPLPPPGQRIALASDAAFTFVYPHLLDAWRRAGAEIATFSPLADEPPPAHCDCCWLPGGYPELHAGRLASAHRFKAGLRVFAQARSVHGECGGYMVLGNALLDARGERHAMAGLLSHVTSFAQRALAIGYREARLRADCALGARGARIRGHEFHHSTLTQPGDDAPLADLFDASGRALGQAGGRRGRVTGSYFHAIAQL
jgi:cobyrinic acid a,c-diamide synthase